MELGLDSAPEVPGWKDSFDEFQALNPIVVHIAMDTDRIHEFGVMTPQQIRRNRPKLELVERLARKLAMNMTKGTFKYPEDEWRLGRWLHMGIDDAMDGLLYMLLAQDRAEKDGTL
jgi:signal recognition particle subunit SEC65